MVVTLTRESYLRDMIAMFKSEVMWCYGMASEWTLGIKLWCCGELLLVRLCDVELPKLGELQASTVHACIAATAFVPWRLIITFIANRFWHDNTNIEAHVACIEFYQFSR